MADVQKPGATPAPKNDGRRRPAESESGGEAAEAGSRAFDEGARQANEGVRAAEAVADKAADATSAAARANVEVLRTQLDTAQQAVRSGLEAGARSFEGLTQSWTRAFGVTTPNPDLAEQSAQNVEAVAHASRALTKGAQDASRAWFELTQSTVRTNLEAMSQLAGCRSVEEVVNVQSNLLRDNLQHALESGDAIARVSSDAIAEASEAIQSRAQLGR